MNQEEQQRLALLATCSAGVVGYGIAAVLQKDADGTKEGEWREYKKKQSTVYLATTAGGVLAGVGTIAFNFLPVVPMWVPTLVTTSCLIKYLKDSWNDLFTEKNNEQIAKHIVTLAPGVFAAGWAAGPLCYFFRKPFYQYFLPASLSATTGFYLASHASATPYSLPLHGATVSLCLSQLVQSCYRSNNRSMTVCSLLCSLGASIYSSATWYYKMPVDVPSHTLCLLAAGAVGFYQSVKRSLRVMFGKMDRLDMRAVNSAITGTLFVLYYWVVYMAREKQAKRALELP
eukprot:TRINITY_DN27686_c0_g1_i1.p1 TRINITY_DN27686_c0_g1~~TRINITY_DN27686_c0_g1_i1.p1  ORF type:complete len:303 (+),score=39.98 TRINITY_DN27686_c0_g1_i1:49-909(+)